MACLDIAELFKTQFEVDGGIADLRLTCSGI